MFLFTWWKMENYDGINMKNEESILNDQKED
jgi:hypothetical protein